MKITKAILDLMPDDLKANFKPVDGEADTFDNGEESAPSLKSALEGEKAAKVKAAQERDAYKAQVDAAEAAKRAAEEKEQREKGDFTKIEESYKSEIQKAKDAAAAAQAALDASLMNSTREGAIAQLLPAFVSPMVGRAVLDRYIKVEKDAEGKAFVRILDDAGSPTGLDLATFQKNLLANPEFKSVMKANLGSGGGATNPTGGGGATPNKLSDFKTLTERAKFAKSNPAEYAELVRQSEAV